MVVGCGVGGLDAEADHATMRVQCSGDRSRVNVIAGKLVAAGAVVVECQAGPTRIVTWVVDVNVVAGVHQLVVEADAFHAIGVGDLGGDMDLFAR